jgi:AcrR family transcriptional regulator
MVRKRENTAIRQKQIIDAARKIIIEYGGEHVTVRGIAKEVGISEADIYRHFRSKRDILSLLADHIEKNLVKDLTRTSTSGDTFLEILDSILRSHLSAIEQRQGISFQVIAEIISLGDKELNQKISGTINKYIALLKELLSEGVKHGEVRDDIELEAAATLLFGMMQGLVNLWALSNYSFVLEEKYVLLWNTFREAVIRRQIPIVTKFQQEVLYVDARKPQ